MTCVLVVPDGLGLRNFCGRFIDVGAEADRILVWHDLPDAVMPFVSRLNGHRVVLRRLPAVRERPLDRLLRQAKVFAQLYCYAEPGSDVVLTNLRPAGRLPNRLIGHAARLLGRLFSGSASRVARLDRLHARVASIDAGLEPFEHVLRLVRPDVVFCTHQRASRAVPAMLAARRLGIPTATFIHSWDNLPKGRMAVVADHFLVWSDFMRSELLAYYREVPPDRVHVVGTPQFEPYFDASLLEPRSVFLERLGLDPARPTVCFSGDDVSTSPYDPVYLSDLAAGLRELPPARRPQVLFRRCPVDVSGRYRDVLRRYPEIAVAEPKWTHEGHDDWTQVLPTPADATLLANVVHHCDAVVNLGSTMAMDFAIVDKPAVYLAYEPAGSDPRGRWNAAALYRLPHLRSVHELQPVHWARSARELAEVVAHSIQHPGEKSVARRAWLDRHVRGPFDEASRRCHEALGRVARDGVPCTSPS
jgi:hypothetical protein